MNADSSFETIVHNPICFKTNKYRPNHDPLVFEKTDSYLELFLSDFDIDPQSDNMHDATVIRLFCNTMAGHSVVVYTQNILFDFLVEWDDQKTIEEQEQFCNDIERMIPEDDRHLYITPQLIYSKNAIGFTNQELFPRMKLQFYSHSLMKYVINRLKSDGRFENKLLETKFPWTLKFSDRYSSNGISPGRWIRMRPGEYQWFSEEETKKRTRFQYACIAPIQACEPLADKLEYPQQLILSLDIETYNGVKLMETPRAEYPANCVTNIGNTLYKFPLKLKDHSDDHRVIHRVIFALKEIKPIKDAEVYWFDHERDLLKAWFDWFSLSVDPEILTGYNYEYDLEFLWLRMDYYNLSHALCWGRFNNEYTPLEYKDNKDDDDHQDFSILTETDTDKQWNIFPDMTTKTHTEEAGSDDEEDNDDQDDNNDKSNSTSSSSTTKKTKAPTIDVATQKAKILRVCLKVDHVMQIKKIEFRPSSTEGTYFYQVHHISPRKYEYDNQWYRHDQLVSYKNDFQKRSFKKPQQQFLFVDQQDQPTVYQLHSKVCFAKQTLLRIDRVIGDYWYLDHSMIGVKNPVGFLKQELLFDGYTTSKSIQMPGRIMRLDLLPIVKKMFKFADYSLGFVANQILNETKKDLSEEQKAANRKHDVSPAEIWASHESDNIEEHTRISAYCLQDTLLPIILLLELLVIEKTYSVCRVVEISPEITMRGEQNKVVSLLLREAHAQGAHFNNAPINHPLLPHTWNDEYIEHRRKVRLENEKQALKTQNGDVVLKWHDKATPKAKKQTKAEKKRQINIDATFPYKGAYVLEPKRGAYVDEVVATLDFTSLYPSIIIAFGLCFSNLVLDDKYANCPGVTYRDDIIQDDDGKALPTFRWADTPGIVPQVLKKLLAERKRIRAIKTNDPLLQTIYELWQLAVKLSANGTYGVFGVRKKKWAKFPFLPISICTTYHGRCNLIKTRELVQTHYKLDIIYGDTDSVFLVLKFPKEWTREQKFGEVIRIATDAAKFVTSHMKPPISLDFEKWAHPFFLWDPKSYGGTFYFDKKVDAVGKQKQSGMPAVRRDTCPFGRKLMTTVANTLFTDGDIEKAKKYVEDQMCKLVRNEIPLTQLEITASLSKSYYVNPVCHAEVAKKQKSRGVIIQGGDRIRYVFIKLPKESQMKDVKAWQKAEDPDYVMQHHLSIDYEWYIEHSLKNKICKYFSLSLENPEVLFEKAYSILKSQNLITSYFSKTTTTTSSNQSKQQNDKQKRKIEEITKESDNQQQSSKIQKTSTTTTSQI